MKKIFLILTVSLFALSGCSNIQMNENSNKSVQSVHYGKLINVRDYSIEKNEINPLAMVGGAAIGGLIGNQVGGGKGKTLATIAGAGLGAYAANEASKTTKIVPMVELYIQDDNGTSYTINQEKKANFYPGQRVRIQINGNFGHVTPN